MGKITRQKIGLVLIQHIDERWRGSWTDPISRKHVRRLLPVTSYAEAKEEALRITRELAAGRGFGTKLRGSHGATVADAMLEAIRHSSANLTTRQKYSSLANAFTDYLKVQAASVTGWGQVTGPVLADFAEHLRNSGDSHDTQRLKLYVVRATARYMTRTYPDEYRDFSGAIRFNRKRGAPPDAAQSILSAKQLRALLKWLSKHEPAVHIWGLLSGVCGLRMLEAAYLRVQDVLWDQLAIRIDASDAHTPKNRHSYRTIPVPASVLGVLRNWIACMKKRHDDGYLFVARRRACSTAKGIHKRLGIPCPDTVSRLWAEAVDSYQAEHKEKSDPLRLPEAFVPRKLRSTFVTALRAAGADFAVLQKYIGHAPDSVLAANYDRISLERLAAIATLAERVLLAAEGQNPNENGEKSQDALH